MRKVYPWHDDVIKWKRFRVTGLLRGKFTGDQSIPQTKASKAELWCFFDVRLNQQLSKNGDASDWRIHRTHYDDIVMVWCQHEFTHQWLNHILETYLSITSSNTLFLGEWTHLTNSRNAYLRYPTMQHIGTEMATFPSQRGVLCISKSCHSPVCAVHFGTCEIGLLLCKDQCRIVWKHVFVC